MTRWAAAGAGAILVGILYGTPELMICGAALLLIGSML